jgi:diguanylate cyclase (GGDEF)-like protein
MYRQNDEQKIDRSIVYALYIMLSCLFTSLLNIIHMTSILDIPMTPVSFIIPVVAGIIFGVLLAHIKLLSRRLQEMAYTDSLTHVYNRLHLTHFLEAEIERVKRYKGTFSIILFDLDYFKKVNDEYGHLTGDRILQQLTKLVSRANRDADILARYGGEEFIILASATDLKGALKHAERLRRDIENYQFGLSRKITASFGVAEFNPEEDDINSLIRRADIALYNAKGQGRNCVVKG